MGPPSFLYLSSYLRYLTLSLMLISALHSTFSSFESDRILGPCIYRLVSIYVQPKTIHLQCKSIVFGWTYELKCHFFQPKTILKRFTVSCLFFENNQIQYGRQHSAGLKSGPMNFGTASLLCWGIVGR